MKLPSRDYHFTSERLGFRLFEEKDIPTMAAISADPEVMRYFPKPQDLEHTKEFIQKMQNQQTDNGYCYYAVDELQSHQFIGFIGLIRVELAMDPSTFTDIGWRLRRQSWGKGYATEGACRCLDYAFETLGLERVYAIAPVVNTPSIAVMKKAGMTYLKEFDHPLLATDRRLRSCVLYIKERNTL